MMKHLLAAALLCSTLAFVTAKWDIKVQPLQKNKKLIHVEGIFTVNQKPFLLISEDRKPAIDNTAAIYPIGENGELGEVIFQEDVQIIDAYMAQAKSIYIENIIIHQGKTLLFFSKRDGRKSKVYWTELEEDCIIDREGATEVMELESGGGIVKGTNFDVRQSPDESKILIVGMDEGNNNSSEYTFKLYSAGMKSKILEKKISAPRRQGWFKGSDQFNTGKDQNAKFHCNFLLNNAGRIFILSDKQNPSGDKHEHKFMSIDGKNGQVSEKEIVLPGKYFGQTIFRLSHEGDANFIVFYTNEKEKLFDPAYAVGPKTNSIVVFSYDGKESKTITDYLLSNEQQSLFYPASQRKPKTDYRIGGYNVSSSFNTPGGDLVLVMEQSFTMEGSGVTARYTGDGLVNVLILDSAFQFKSSHAFVRFSNIAKHKDFAVSQAFIRNGQLELLYCNENHQLNWVNLSVKDSRPINLGTKYTETCFVLPNSAALYKGGYLIPMEGKGVVGCSLLR